MLHGTFIRIGGFRERLWFWGKGLNQESGVLIWWRCNRTLGIFLKEGCGDLWLGRLRTCWAKGSWVTHLSSHRSRLGLIFSNPPPSTDTNTQLKEQ